MTFNIPTMSIPAERAPRRPRVLAYGLALVGSLAIWSLMFAVLGRLF